MDPREIANKGTISKQQQGKRQRRSAAVQQQQQQPEVGGTDFKGLADKGALGSLSVAELKAFCKEKNLRTIISRPKKDDLIKTITSHFASSSSS